jgi:hypothetical protein
MAYSECTARLDHAGRSDEKWARPYGPRIALAMTDMPHQEDTVNLQAFVDASKAKDASDEFLAALLIRRGWPADDVYAALGNYWERATGVPVPQRAASGESSRDAFLYLLSFSTLATWITALGSMLFQFIDRWIPDPVSGGYVPDLRSQVTWQMASIAVAFPIFLIVMRVIFREAADHPERRQSGVRKWLTWIALLVTAGTMIGDLICFLGYFLMGELSAHFVLKSATVIALCAAVFAYYVVSLRWNRSTDVARERKRGIGFGAAAAAVVIAAFCVGLGVVGPPSEQRHIEADRTRARDLRTIAYAVKNSYSQSAKIPGTLTGLNIRRLTDPETNAAYEYRPTAGTSFEVCATFNANLTSEAAFWNHTAGRNCFVLDANLQIPW